MICAPEVAAEAAASDAYHAAARYRPGGAGSSGWWRARRLPGGVYQALDEAGIEPDWVIGTSIGAINASLIAGNAPENRFTRLREFWARMEHGPLQRDPPAICRCSVPSPPLG